MDYDEFDDYRTEAEPDAPRPTFARLNRLLREELETLTELKALADKLIEKLDFGGSLGLRLGAVINCAANDKDLGSELEPAEIEHASKCLDNRRRDVVKNALFLLEQEVAVTKNGIRLLAVLNSIGCEFPREWSNLPPHFLARKITDHVRLIRATSIEIA